jgi:hypothetical protein
MHLDAALLEPGGVLVREDEHAHALAALLERGHEVVPKEPVAAGDQDVHAAPSSTGDQWRRR